MRACSWSDQHARWPIRQRLEWGLRRSRPRLRARRASARRPCAPVHLRGPERRHDDARPRSSAHAPRRERLAAGGADRDAPRIGAPRHRGGRHVDHHVDHCADLHVDQCADHHVDHRHGTCRYDPRCEGRTTANPPSEGSSHAGRPDDPILTTSRNADFPIRLHRNASHRYANHRYANHRHASHRCGDHPNANHRCAILPSGVHPNDSRSPQCRHSGRLPTNGRTKAGIRQNAATHFGTNLMRDGEFGQKAWLARLRDRNQDRAHPSTASYKLSTEYAARSTPKVPTFATTTVGLSRHSHHDVQTSMKRALGTRVERAPSIRERRMSG